MARFPESLARDRSGSPDPTSNRAPASWTGQVRPEAGRSDSQPTSR